MRMLSGLRVAVISTNAALFMGCGGSTEVQLAKVPPAQAEPGVATKKPGVPIRKGPSSSGMAGNPLDFKLPENR